MDIINNTDRISRLTPKKVMITNVIDIDIYSSEETPDRLHQLLKIRCKKLGIDLIILKEPSDVGKPRTTVYFIGDKDSGKLLDIQDSIDLGKPRTITDIVETSVINLVQNKLYTMDRKVSKDMLLANTL